MADEIEDVAEAPAVEVTVEEAPAADPAEDATSYRLGALEERVGRLEAIESSELADVADDVEQAAEIAVEAAADAQLAAVDAEIAEDVAEDAAEVAVVAAVVADEDDSQADDEAAEEIAEAIIEQDEDDAPSGFADEPEPDEAPAQSHWFTRKIGRR